MKDQQLNKKIATATKWSSITQIIAKLIVPITNIVLARILTPEAFGVIATITMIVSFVDMFSDAGFQKYLIQQEFKNENEKKKNANVAFWTNFVISLIIFSLVVLFNEQIAVMVGNPGLGFVIVIACVQLPLTSFSSIQMALFRRDFDFKTLFIVRVSGICIPFVITIPLALFGFGYWSLIFGMITTQLLNAVLLTIKSQWKPGLFYDFKILHEMFSFSVWSLFEAISIWFTTWVDTFIIGYFLNQYYLGIYKTSTIMVNSLLALVTAAIVPVLFSALSRLQYNNVEFINIYFKFQRLVSILVFPIGVGVYLYSDLASQILLGNQWGEASGVIGIWALTSAVMIVFGHFCSEVYRAKGKPKLSFLAQILHLVVLVPVCIIAAKYGFWTLVFARALIRMQFVLVHLIIMKTEMKFSISKTFMNVFPSMLAVSIMFIVGSFLKDFSDNTIWTLISISICSVVYFSLIVLFPRIRVELISIGSRVIPRKYLKTLKTN